MASSRLKISSSESCVVMYVDMVQSTRTTCQIGDSDRLRLFYEIFINMISDIVISRGGRVVKNGGDSIICYFPKTKDCIERSAFNEMLHCGMEIIQARKVLNSCFEAAGLPRTSYRVSADFGKHEVVKDQNSDIVDIFSPTMCICAKINSLAPPNCMVIGGDLYMIVKPEKDFNICSYGEYPALESRKYPVFLVCSKKL